jgi:uncharacterized protein (TIGR04141 family)
MTKSRSFSVYLLKEKFEAPSALKADHTLTEVTGKTGVPDSWKIYLYDPAQRQPWWAQYFGIKQKLNQSTKGALIFFESNKRNFALSFGPAHHSLRDESYEYDFGLLVTLNCVDPNLIRNTDVLQPGSARRMRTQLASRSDLTYFDFDGDNSILRTLSGNIRPEYQHLFKFATGASNLKINSTATPDELVALCGKLLEIYKEETYKDSFPGIRNITPVRDPEETRLLDQLLIQAVRERDENVSLAVPALVDYQEDFWIMFGRLGTSQMYADVDLNDYYVYVESHKQNVEKLTVEDLRRHELRLVNDDGLPYGKFSVYKSLTFDVKPTGASGTFYLSEGNWYEAEDKFVADLKAFLDARCVSLWLPACDEKPEGTYNKAAAEKRPGAICLDTTSTSPGGQTAIEPCDIYSVVSDTAVLTHVKIGTGSATLSHLFNQGANAVQLLQSSPSARDRLIELLRDRGGSDDECQPVQERTFKVEYAIISRKNAAKRSDNLPLFSRISLKRALVDLDLMRVPATYGFVQDATTKAPPKTKPRKKPVKKKS